MRLAVAVFAEASASGRALQLLCLPFRGSQLRECVGTIRCGDPGQGARGEAARLPARAIGQRILAVLFLILTGRFVDDLFSADAGEKIAGLRWSGAE